MNPFSDEYVRREIEFYGLTQSTIVCSGNDSISVKPVELLGRCDDYINVNFRAGGISVPILRINGTTWMSLTPMELQSAWVPLQLSHGIVATASLGLGYFALRAAAKKSVKRVDAYENNPAVIAFFNATFANRKELRKINIIQADVRKSLTGKTYDVVFMDPYQEMLPNEVLTDACHFKKLNTIGTYRYWCQELVTWKAVEYCIPCSILDIERELFSHYFNSKCSRLRSREIDPSFVRKAVRL